MNSRAGSPLQPFHLPRPREHESPRPPFPLTLLFDFAARPFPTNARFRLCHSPLSHLHSCSPWPLAIRDASRHARLRLGPARSTRILCRHATVPGAALYQQCSGECTTVGCAGTRVPVPLLCVGQRRTARPAGRPGGGRDACVALALVCGAGTHWHQHRRAVVIDLRR